MTEPVTPPIRVRRRWESGFDPREAYPGYRWTTDPWFWRCHHGGHTAMVPCAYGNTLTQPEAVAAGLAHLKEHTEDALPMLKLPARPAAGEQR